MEVPRKPFENYKWRWAAYQPTEGLNDPRVYLGVLRALRDNEGEPPNSTSLMNALEDVGAATGTDVSLARSEERNLIRNSGQYWKAFNLYKPNKGLIGLTTFGRNVADSLITRAEFAAIIIKTLTLPNKNLEESTERWDNANLEIKPLELILQILEQLKAIDNKQAFIRPLELIKVTIPLAGAKAGLDEHVDALIQCRAGLLNIDAWPDCAPEANDRRMAREFLLFLWHYEICDRKQITRNNLEEEYILKDLSFTDVKPFLDLDVRGENLTEVIQKVRESQFPETTERKRILTEILDRPQQAVFRKKVLKAYDSKCFLTGFRLSNVLEAAHIIPVKYDGKDEDYNGIALRADIHILFDSGDVRIDPYGKVHLSDAAKDAYHDLPESVTWPDFVRMELIAHRWKYY